MAEQSDNAEVCTICRGSVHEHGPGKTQHAFTTNPGELLTHRQKQQATSGPQQPTVIRLPGAQTNEASAIGRLVEVLMDKGIVTMQEGLYIAGFCGKPKSEAQRSGFADPAEGRLF